MHSYFKKCCSILKVFTLRYSLLLFWQRVENFKDGKAFQKSIFFSLKIITEDYAVWASVRHRCILDLDVLVPQSLPLLHLAMDIISQEANLKFNLKTRNKWHTFSTFQPKLQEKELRNKKSTAKATRNSMDYSLWPTRNARFCLRKNYHSRFLS